MKDLPAACLRTCAEPWDCPGTERCGYYYGVLVCIPETLVTPDDAYYTSANLDCFSRPGETYDRCFDGNHVQSQPFGLSGLFKGSMCPPILQRRCQNGCESPDKGIARCKGPDAGTTIPDLGAAKVHCCPFGPTYSFNRWHHRGGAKVPPNACRIVPCPSYECKAWLKTTDKYGCKVMLPKPKDAGVDGG